MSRRTEHLAALTSLLAADAEAGRLHTQHLRLLGDVIEAGGVTTLTDCARRVGLSYTQVSRLAKLLIERGLMERTWNRDDARRHLVTPTAKGRALDDRVRGYVAAAKPATRHPPSTEDITP